MCRIGPARFHALGSALDGDEVLKMVWDATAAAYLAAAFAAVSAGAGLVSSGLYWRELRGKRLDALPFACDIQTIRVLRPRGALVTGRYIHIGTAQMTLDDPTTHSWVAGVELHPAGTDFHDIMRRRTRDHVEIPLLLAPPVGFEAGTLVISVEIVPRAGRRKRILRKSMLTLTKHPRADTPAATNAI
jgi:hypothetical protein